MKGHRVPSALSGGITLPAPPRAHGPGSSSDLTREFLIELHLLSPSPRLVGGAESSSPLITGDQPHPEDIQGRYLCHLICINSSVIKMGTLCKMRHSSCSGNSTGLEFCSRHWGQRPTRLFIILYVYVLTSFF